MQSVGLYRILMETVVLYSCMQSSAGFLSSAKSRMSRENIVCRCGKKVQGKPEVLAAHLIENDVPRQEHDAGLVRPNDPSETHQRIVLRFLEHHTAATVTAAFCVCCSCWTVLTGPLDPAFIGLLDTLPVCPNTYGSITNNLKTANGPFTSDQSG